MTPLTKEAIEATSSTTETGPARVSSPSRPGAPTLTPASNQMHSDAVSLEIPVKVHGSRVTEVVPGSTQQTEPFEEQTTTMIVFAQGGVLKMNSPISVGQMMVLTNLKSRQDVICRVLKVRNNPNLQAYVEVEFTHAQPGYWGVFFPSDGPEFAPKPAKTVQSLSLEPESNNRASEERSRQFAPLVTKSAPKAPISITRDSAEKRNADARIEEQARNSSASSGVAPVGTDATPAQPAPTYTAPAPQPQSAFIGIGSQEDVQVAAATTIARAKKRASLGARDPRLVNVSEKAPVNSGGVALSSASLSIAELQGDTGGGIVPAAQNSAISAASAQVQQSTPVENFAHAPQASSEIEPEPISAPAREMFSSTLGATAMANSAPGGEPRRNWILIAACSAIAAVAAAGGVMYFRAAPPSGGTAVVASTAPSVQSVDSSQGGAVPSAPSNQSAISIPIAAANSAAAGNAKPNSARNSRAIVSDHNDRADVENRGQSASASPKQSAPSASPNAMAATLNAHPLTTQHGSTNQTDAPMLDAGLNSSNGAGALSGLSTTSNALPPPPPTVARVGGALKEPKLISSPAPVYSVAARQATMDGDVVIHAAIDKNGNVIKADVVSGPMMLRQAALAAVRQWKYSPGLLDGAPVESQTTVTLKFRR